MGDLTRVLRSAGVVGAFTLFSRFTGLIRDVVLFPKLGAGAVADIFLIAFEIPNLVRRVMGEGSLSAFMVPLFSQRRHEFGDQAGWLFFNRVVNLLFLVAFAITLLGGVFAREVFVIFGGAGLFLRGEGFELADAYIALGARYTRIMFPFTIGLTVASVMMGACHTLRSFAAPSLGSVMLNLSMIAAAAAALMLQTDAETAALWLCWAVLVGAVLRIVIMLPVLARHGWRWGPCLTLRDPQLLKLLRMMGLAFAGMAIGPLTVIMSGTFAMYLGEGVKAYIVCSNRLIQLPMALTASAIATAMLPQMADYLLQGRGRELSDMMALTKRLELVLMAPAMMGLIVFGLPILDMLFLRQNWTHEASVNTWWALAAYAPGLIPLGWVRIYNQLFYARQDLMTPLKAALLAFVVTLAFNVLFAFATPLAQAGLALAATFGSFANYAYMARALRGALEAPSMPPRVAETTVKTCLAAAVASGLGYLGYWLTLRRCGAPDDTLSRAAMLLPWLAATALLYFGLIRLVRVAGSREVSAMFIRRLRGRRARPAEDPPDEA